MKKVLVIARAFPPFLPVGHSIRVVKFLKYLPALGWLPVVLTVDDKREYETLRRVGSESLMAELPPQIEIHRTPAGEPSLGYLEREQDFGRWNWLTRTIAKVIGGARRWTLRTIFLPDRYLGWIPFALHKGHEIVRSHDIKAIFVTCPPYSAALVGAGLKRLTHKPLVLDFRDDWMDTPWYLSKQAFARGVERRMESWAVRTADKVILVTERSREAFQSRYPQESESKFILISNGCDLEEFSMVAGKQALAHPSKFMILHAGSLNVAKFWGRNPTGLFQAVQNIICQHPEMGEKLILAFAGDLPEEYQQLATSMGLSTVVQALGHLPHDEVLRLMKSADLLLAMNYDGWATLIPGKIYEYWAMGGPPILLLSCPGAASDFIANHGLGFSIDPTDVNGIQHVIQTVFRQRLIGQPVKIDRKGINSYDRRVLAGQLARTLTDVSSLLQ